MTLTYLNTFQLVQERNGETCEFASFTEVSSTSLASLANTPISLIKLNRHGSLFWLGRAGGRVRDSGGEENGTPRPHELKDIRLRFRKVALSECLAGSVGIFGWPSQVVFHIHRL